MPCARALADTQCVNLRWVADVCVRAQFTTYVQTGMLSDLICYYYPSERRVVFVVQLGRHALRLSSWDGVCDGSGSGQSACAGCMILFAGYLEAWTSKRLAVLWDSLAHPRQFIWAVWKRVRAC